MAPYEGPIGLAFLDRPGVAEQLELVKLVDKLGYESAWVTETRLARDAISILGAFATATTRITLGPAVVNTWTRGPALMAVTAATLHEMAPARFVLGLGAYWDPLAWKQGIERSRPLEQMREYVGVVRRLLRLEEGVTFEGVHVKVRDLTLDLGHGVERKPVEVPIYIGATGLKMMELAGEIADGVLLNGNLSQDYTRTAVSVAQASAAKVGRASFEGRMPQLVNVAMDADRDVARRAARRFLAMYLGQQPHMGKASGLDEEFLQRLKETVGGWPPRPGGIEEAVDLINPELVNRFTVAGTADDCRDAIGGWVEAGASYPVIVPLTDNYAEICTALAPRGT